MADSSDRSKLSDRVLQIVILFAVLCVGAALGITSWRLLGRADGPEVVLPLLAIGGVLSLLIVLALMSVFFETLGLANKEQALALPEGSVRAVIALSLIVLFAILSIYLYASLRAAGPHTPVSDDFAKQLLVMMGTLVTAVASFYFGANTVASAHKAAKEGEGNRDQDGDPDEMSLEGIDKTAATQGESLSFKISGKGLGSVTEANFVRDDADPIPTKIDQKGPTQVSATAKIPDNAKAGPWNLEVKGPAATKTLAGKFEIKQKQE
jgi:hypothetical protein